MLTIACPNSPTTYFGKEGLEKEGGFRLSTWGKLADSLKLAGVAAREAMQAIFSNRTPWGDRLTQRDRKDKRTCTDFCFSPPKGVAIAHQLGGDERIPQAVIDSALDTMNLIQPEFRVRVRGEYQTTGNAIGFPEYHLTTRPENGEPDPGDHIHVPTANASEWRGNRYSVDLKHIADEAPFYRWHFQQGLAKRLHGLGYDLRHTEHGFELAGIPERVISEFSRRSEAIEQEFRRREGSLMERIQGSQDPAELARLEKQLDRLRSPKGKAALAGLTREKKV